ncbi:TRAP transporter small permease [Tropicimonas sp.]|uniref:TRAP transporter small permease n=1 Tax=Tropicimonas sp. TaxID=2067044 RepID=UPI003A888972
MSSRYEPRTNLGRLVNTFEETFIAALLGVMTMITFVNVVIRYVFNSSFGRWLEKVLGIDLPTSLIWGLEVVLVLFAWLVLYGISYGFKINSHLGVDALLNVVSRGTGRVLTIVAALLCVFYAMLLMKGAWDYWAPFAGFEATTGRWFPTGFDPATRDQAWYETDQIPMLDWLRFLEPIFNEGEPYEKLPRFIPYFILPLGAALILLRVVQATMRVISGYQESMIVSHEAEDAVEDVAAMNRED